MKFDFAKIIEERLPADESGIFRFSENDKEYTVLPGFADVHVHFREPGFSYKETVKTGSLAAVRGGCTAVCTMPNLSPVPDCPENLKIQTDIIERDAVIPVYPYGAITVGEKGETVADLEGMSENVIAFSDDGRGIMSASVMKEAMKRAKALGKIIAAHCEDKVLVDGGYINRCRYAEIHGHRGISAESEWGMIERDLDLAAETGCSYHVCHVSCRESVELIRQAKKSGVDVTCETAPHYLLLDDSCLKEEGRYKMNPPLRSPDDREAMVEGIADGTVDMIATDHAPHSAEEKSKGLKDSPFGIVGLETAFPLLYTGLVKTGIISLTKLADLMSYAPCRRFGINNSGAFGIWNLDDRYEIDSSAFASMGKSTPFEGMTVYGSCVGIIIDGKFTEAK